MECSQKYLLITNSPDIFTNLLLLHSLKYEQYRYYSNGKPGLAENKEIPMNICIKYACVCSDKFYVGKFHLNNIMCHCHHLSTKSWYWKLGLWTIGNLDYGRLET